MFFLRLVTNIRRAQLLSVKHFDKNPVEFGSFPIFFIRT